jgi:CRP/FNR family transcriptional regulator, dissimilatory nitrate respiration regulator
VRQCLARHPILIQIKDSPPDPWWVARRRAQGAGRHAAEAGGRMSPEDWAIVERAPIFSAMGEALTRSLLRDRGPRCYDRGEQVFQQGEPADAFFVVLDGWIKLYRELPTGDHVVVAIFAAGETFAEAAMFLGGRYPASAQAVSSARLLRVDGQRLRSAILKTPQIAFNMLAAASLHLKHFVEQIEQLKVQSAPERTADFLIAQTSVRRGPVKIALPYEKALIANRLGMTPESFSRALARLRDLGVAVEREAVTVQDMARLAAFVEQSRDLSELQPPHDKRPVCGTALQ